LNQHGAFDPRTSTQNFTISMADVGEVYFLPEFMPAIAREAPHVSITSVRHAGNLLEEMAGGKVDLAVGALPGLKTNFFQRRLFPQRYVCLLRHGHPLDKPKITPAEFAAAEHVIVIAPGTGHSRMNEIMLRAGVRRIVPLRVPHWVSVADILATTNLVATVPEKFAERGAAYFGLKYVPHPIKLPQVQINLYWHARYHREPANQWLRTYFFNMFSE
jgi:DNA-binding transcriptional LysR family regulator